MLPGRDYGMEGVTDVGTQRGVGDEQQCLAVIVLFCLLNKLTIYKKYYHHHFSSLISMLNSKLIPVAQNPHTRPC